MSDAKPRYKKILLKMSGEVLMGDALFGIDTKTIEAVAALKQEEGPDLMIWGSSTIYPQLLAAGLLDRLMLMIYPVTLGSGKRLFGDGTPPCALKMIDHKVTSAGTIIATYEPDGPVPTEPPASPQPIDSKRERERQRKIEDGTW